MISAFKKIAEFFGWKKNEPAIDAVGATSIERKRQTMLRRFGIRQHKHDGFSNPFSGRKYVIAKKKRKEQRLARKESMS